LRNQGNLVALLLQGLVGIGISASNVTGEEMIPLGTRIRDVEQGPDGAVYLLTDHRDGHILRLRPQQ
jgi:glucose/arabinose dehydrogenase